jgi:hypothetical protein
MQRRIAIGVHGPPCSDRCLRVRRLRPGGRRGTIFLVPLEVGLSVMHVSIALQSYRGIDVEAGNHGGKGAPLSHVRPNPLDHLPRGHRDLPVPILEAGIEDDRHW